MSVRTNTRLVKSNFQINLEQFDNAREVIEANNVRAITDSAFCDMRNYDIQKSWHGVDSYDEAMGLFRDGYKAATEKIKERLNASFKGEGKRISFKNDIVGFAPIVPLALQGVPQSMINTTIKPIKAKVIDVVYDIVSNSGTSPEKIIEIGCKILGAVVGLENDGYRINLYAMQTYTREGNADVLCVKVKDSRQPLDIARVSFPFMHPAFFRVVGFDWYSKVPEGRYRSAYGQNIWSLYHSHNKPADIIRAALKKDNAVVLFAQELNNGAWGGNRDINEVIKDESRRQSGKRD